MLQEEDAYKVKKAKVFRFSEKALEKYEQEEKDDYNGFEGDHDGMSLSERAKCLVNEQAPDEDLVDQSVQTVVSVDCSKVLSRELLQPFTGDEEAFMDFRTEENSSNYGSPTSSAIDLLEHKHLSRR